MLHLHGFEDEQRLAAGDGGTGLDEDRRHLAGHRRLDPAGGRLVREGGGQRLDQGELQGLAAGEEVDLAGVTEPGGGEAHFAEVGVEAAVGVEVAGDGDGLAVGEGQAPAMALR